MLGITTMLRNLPFGSSLLRELSTGMRRISRGWLALLMLLAITSPSQAITKEYQVKLAYLYKFALYVTWPEDYAAENLVIGILGPNPFGSALDLIASKKPNGKDVTVKYFAGWEEYEPCHILFISRGLDPATHAGGLQRIGDHPVLIVGDSTGPELPHVVFDFYLDAENRVGIRMNIDAAERRRLRADARLMQVCDIVRGERK